MAGLNWQQLTLKFEGSLEQKGDPRLGAPPDFDTLKDAHFEDAGGLQTRPPFGAVMGAGAVFGGGTLANCRRQAVVNGELCVFTDTSLYAWNAQLSQWVLRGTHPAVTVDETPRFVTTGDQTGADRAELNGTIVYAWFEASGAIGGNAYAAAIDKTTGSVLMTQTLITPVTGASISVRLVALATKILLFTMDGNGPGKTLSVRAIDPANPLAGVQSVATSVLTGSASASYDVTRVLGQDQAVGARVMTAAANYTVFTVTAGLVVATSNKARTADGAIAVASRPSAGAQTHIFRSVDGTTAILGDVVTTSTLADVATAQAIGTFTSPANYLTACYRSVQTAGHFVCRVFWVARAFSDPVPEIKSNTVDDAGTIGSQASFVGGMSIASRAFDYAGSVYVWLIFALSNQATVSDGAQLQNTYFLYREDPALIAKAVPDVAGGYDLTPTGPTVALTSGSTAFAWAGASRRSLITEQASGFAGSRAYAARSLADITLTFDSNEARRVAVLGRTAYISGGEILAYDGVRIVECGFNIFGYSFAPTDAGAGAGSIAAGAYSYKSTYRYTNAVGETERSTSTSESEVTIAAATSTMSAPTGSGPLYTTRKTSPAPEFEVWRTKVTAGEDAPFFRVTSLDPNATTNPNRYLPNAVPIAAFTDTMSDTDIGDNETNPENGTLLESLAPPGAKIIVPTETRLLLAGVAGDPDAWWYSRERNEGEIASFHDTLRVEVPPVGGAITALWADDQFVYVGRETAIYAYAGPGKANDDSGQNFTLVRTISRDVGVVSQEAHAPTPVGRLFKSSKGWYILDGGGGLRYVGGSVADYDSDTVVAVHTITAKHQVRVLTTSRLLMWDYRGLIATSQSPGRWAEWSVTGGLDACLYNGVYTILTTSGPKQESASYSGLTYGLDARTNWIKPADLMGAVAVRSIQPLGEYRSAFLLWMRLYYNYDETTVVDQVVWNPSPTTVGGPLQMSHGPKRRQCEAIKVRLTAVAAGVQASLATASALSHVVATSGTNWAATFAAKTGYQVNGALPVIGELGNNVTMSISFELGTTTTIDVRDHYAYDISTSAWSPDMYNVGVRVVCAAGGLTVAALETGIAAATDLIQVSAADGTPSKTIDIATMNGLTVTGSFTGGTFTAPTGEALKLSGLALEVGIVRPTYKRLPRAQRA